MGILVWCDGLKAGRQLNSPDNPAKPSLWQRGGAWLKRFFKQPTPGTVMTFFIVLLMFRLLLGLLPILLVLLASLLFR